MRKVLSPDYCRLLEAVEKFSSSHFKIDLCGIHGLSHWRWVRSFGFEVLAGENLMTADHVLFVELFAFLHDVERENEYADSMHGARSAKLVQDLPLLNTLPVEMIRRLVFACRNHTGGRDTGGDIMAGVCWDADRLDLSRFGWEIDPCQLATDTAKNIAQKFSDSDDVFSVRLESPYDLS